MGRVYRMVFTDVAVTLAQDLFSILPAANKPCALHAVYLSQNTEVADAAEEGLTINIVKGNTTVGSGGAAEVADPLNINTSATAVAGRVNDTTEVSAGTAVIVHTEVWNVRMPFIYLPAPEDRIIWGNALFLAIQLITVPADSITMTGTAVFEELA